LVLFGTGVVAASLFTGAQVGLWQVAVVWGIGVALAIYATAAVSGAHLNPAVSLAFAIFRRKEFPVPRLLAYWASQLAGAMLAGLTVLWAFGRLIQRFEQEHGILRGDPGSELSASAFGEYFPNPSMFGTGLEARELVSSLQAASVEALGTAVLLFMVFALVDRRNTALPTKDFAPLLIGLTVAVLISLFAPLTQAGWNPARDFGPRVVAYFAGWGTVAVPGPSSGFWAYIVGPLVGGPIGAAAYEFLVRPGMRALRGSTTAEGKQTVGSE
jgi:MIP family channel proteins